MEIQNFLKNSGFKVLALAQLSQYEYSILLYLLNCEASGLDQIITNEEELASLIGYDKLVIQQSLLSLAERQMIKIHYSHQKSRHDNYTVRLAFQFDMSKWQLGQGKEKSSSDAIVFPFRRYGQANLQIFEGDRKPKPKRDANNKEDTWKRIFESYVQGRSLDDGEMLEAERISQILVETHPVDQVLLMLRHFGTRIPTLSLLASSWQHYQEIFEDETQKIDMLEARQKHIELDEKLRERAEALVRKSEEMELSEEERTVLDIILKHRHPRRQLFWAFQLRSRYPKLDSFFEENMGLMLPVTSGGTVVKKLPWPEA